MVFKNSFNFSILIDLSLKLSNNHQQNISKNIKVLPEKYGDLKFTCQANPQASFCSFRTHQGIYFLALDPIESSA